MELLYILESSSVKDVVYFFSILALSQYKTVYTILVKCLMRNIWMK